MPSCTQTRGWNAIYAIMHRRPQISVIDSYAQDARDNSVIFGAEYASPALLFSSSRFIGNLFPLLSTFFFFLRCVTSVLRIKSDQISSQVFIPKYSLTNFLINQIKQSISFLSGSKIKFVFAFFFRASKLQKYYNTFATNLKLTLGTLLEQFWGNLRLNILCIYFKV